MKGEKGWESSKESRRNLIAKNYRVLMIFGDNFIDFVEVSAHLPNNEKIVSRNILIIGEKSGLCYRIQYMAIGKDLFMNFKIFPKNREQKSV